MRTSIRRPSRWLGALTLLAVVALGAWAFAAPSPPDAEPLARQVAAEVESDAPRSKGEFGLVTDQMAILGLGQLVLAHPETRDRWLPVMEKAAEHMMRPSQRSFATREWGSDGLAHLDDDRGEAWLGWPDVALSMLRRVDPDTRFAALNDRITDALERRLAAAPHGLIETYPRMSFPTDVAACAAAIALRAEALHRPPPLLLGRWTKVLREQWIDPGSGYLWQRGNAATRRHGDAPRGSGTAVTAYFLSFVDPALSAELTRSLAQHQRELLGLHGVLEYPAGYSGHGDTDSGPVVDGASVTATGFTLGAARANGDAALFDQLWKTTRVFGRPVTVSGKEHFLTGGAVGDAILLAQLTALPRPEAR